jgi:hypothetical protein
METQSVYSRLKKMQGILDQVPKDVQKMYGMRIRHSEEDSIWLIIDVPSSNHIAFSDEADILVRVSDLVVEVRTRNIYLTLWTNTILFHTSIFG